MSAPGEATAEVAGALLHESLAAPRPERPRVAIVVSSWGERHGEKDAAIRLVAGAVALDAEVTIVSLDDRRDLSEAPVRRYYDGIFPVHSAAAETSDHRVAEIARAALARPDGADDLLPETAARGIIELESRLSPECLGIIEHLAPDIVVLAGIETLWLAVALPVGPARPRVVALPLLGADPLLASRELAPLAETTAAIGAFSLAEHTLLERSAGARRDGLVHDLHPAFPVNEGAAHSGMAGMASFGRYLLVISGFPDDGSPAGTAPAHDLVRSAVGDLSVAEVRPGRWLVTDGARRFDVVWTPSRMNLWRLMAQAVATVDVRPPGPIGREVIESLRFGTPVIVPEGTVAAEHARRSGGGLWYAQPGELLDAARYFVEHELERDRFGASGRAWAVREHGDGDRFAAEVRRLVFG